MKRLRIQRELTEEEIRYINDNWQEKTDSEIASEIGLTKNRVYAYRRTHYMYKCVAWTEHEEKFIRDNYKLLSDTDIASEIGRTHQAVKRKRQKMGLKKSKGGGLIMPPGRSSMNILMRDYISSADERGIVFDLTEEEFEIITRKSCHYCGAPPSREISKPHLRGTYKYNGIDRVNNTIGYTIGNVVPCCKMCNYSKRQMSVDDFIDWIIRAHDHLVGDVAI